MISHSGSFVSFNEDLAPMAYMMDNVNFCYKSIYKYIKLYQAIWPEYQLEEFVM
jgi:hypothetical protein